MPQEHFNISPHDHPFGGRNENASAKERECKGVSKNERVVAGKNAIKENVIR